MIALLGSKKDDLLYLSEYCDELSEELSLPCGYKYRLAKLDGVEVLLCNVGESSYISSIVTSELLSLYSLPLIIKVGDGVGLDPSFELGDIVYVDNVYPHGVNFHADGLRYGEIPGGIPAVLPTDKSYLSRLEESGFALKKGLAMSGEKAIYEKGEFESILKRRFLYLDKMGVYDPSIYGVALSSYLHQSSLVILETVSFILGDEDGKLNQRRIALQTQPEVGRIIASLLGGDNL